MATGNAEFLRAREDARVRDIAQNQGHIKAGLPGSTRVGQGNQVRTLPRAQDAHARFLNQFHSLSVLQSTPTRQDTKWKIDFGLVLRSAAPLVQLQSANGAARSTVGQ